MSAEMTVRDVEGWPLGFAGSDTEPRILDTELAGRLGFVQPLSIRKLIGRMERADKLGDVLSTVEKNRRGRPGRAFWLTEEQALLVTTQSETAKAWALTREIIRVFRAALRGTALDGRVTRLEQENVMLRAKLELVDPMGPGVIGKPRADVWILAPLREAARRRCAIAGDFSETAFRRKFRELEEQVRLHVGFAATTGAGKWENLPILRLGDAMQKTIEIAERAKREARRAAAELDARISQLALPDAG